MEINKLEDSSRSQQVHKLPLFGQIGFALVILDGEQTRINSKYICLNFISLSLCNQQGMTSNKKERQKVGKF